MAGLIGSLLGSQPVAGFQRRCGLFPRGEEPRAQAVGNGNRPLTPRDVRNGQRPGVSLPTDCATCNGSPGDGWKECSQDYVVKNYFYYYLFRISAAMGQEVFYITFLPFTYWIINAYVARRLIIMWSVVMYIGQVMKDLLKWPRPHSPPVVKLEKKTNAEYGMPSTHAMAATVISFTFVSVTANQYKGMGTTWSVFQLWRYFFRILHLAWDALEASFGMESLDIIYKKNSPSIIFSIHLNLDCWEPSYFHLW